MPPDVFDFSPSDIHAVIYDRKAQVAAFVRWAAKWKLQRSGSVSLTVLHRLQGVRPSGSETRCVVQVRVQSGGGDGFSSAVGEPADQKGRIIPLMKSGTLFKGEKFNSSAPAC